MKLNYFQYAIASGHSLFVQWCLIEQLGALPRLVKHKDIVRAGDKITSKAREQLVASVTSFEAS